MRYPAACCGEYSLFSPDSKFICIDYGVSGYWGYLVGKINVNSIKPLLHGKQYSYCMIWLNDREVLLQENPYWSYGNYYYYSFNTLTESKNFLFGENSHSRN